MRPSESNFSSRTYRIRFPLVIIFLPCLTILGQVVKSSDAKRNQAVSQAGVRTPQATQKSEDVDPGHRSPEIQNLILEVNAAPPEIAVDALIRIAESKNVSSRTWKKEILENAFQLTSKAIQQVKRKNNPSINLSADTSANYLSHAFDRKLDALSLRIRVIKAMLTVDKRRAREMFEEISPKLPLPPLTCEDVLVYDVSDYYELIGDIANNSFNVEEMREGAPTRFIRTYIDAISSPSQIAPAIKMISSVKISSDDFVFLAQGLIKAVSGLPVDDRSFTYAVSNDDLTGNIYQFAQALEKKGPYLVKELLDTYRTYLRGRMSGPRCAENAVTDKTKTPRYIQQANYELFSSSPLKFDEIRQAEISGRATVSEYWKTPEAERLLDLFKDLRFTPVKRSPGGNDPSEENASRAVVEERFKPTTDAEKESLEWQTKFREFLTALEGWEGDHEKSRLDYFNQQQVLYRQLLNSAPRGPIRIEVFRSWIKSLSNNDLGESDRIQFYLYVYYLSEAASSSSPEEREEILRLMSYSNNPAISTCGKLARLQI